MFSDTHFHFPMLCENDAGRAAEILREMCGRDCFFAMDIGTKCDDLARRQEFAANAIGLLNEKSSQSADGLQNADFSTSAGSLLDGNELARRAEKMLFFSAGIWPAAEAIKNRDEQVKMLRASIEAAEKNAHVHNAKIVALGECGLDHHWNKEGVDNRDEADFSENILAGEAEMFEMQLELAREMKLPVIVHSRDAFEGTYDCIKNVGYDNGIIHCFSYGAKEVSAFVERGWYVSFSGSVTYTKKSKLDAMRETINAVPCERLLLETDAPYLSPVPLRGQPNTPLNVCHTYQYVAEMRGVSVEELCATVDENCKKLFGVGN